MPDKSRAHSAGSAAGGKTDWAALDAITDEELGAAALADPDCPPANGDVTLHPMAQAKRIRLKLKLSQSVFAERYHIPLSTLAAWERHDAEPDAVAVAFLDAIRADPEGLARALSKPAAAE